jgi:hypothetical protein
MYNALPGPNVSHYISILLNMHDISKANPFSAKVKNATPLADQSHNYFLNFLLWDIVWTFLKTLDF